MAGHARWAWVALAVLLAAGALVVAPIPSPRLDWQPALWADEPMRLWTAALVHYSAKHLAANLAGAVVVALLGWRARLDAASVAAWAVAWPLTHVLLAMQPVLLDPPLLHYGGLSGVLHAGVCVVAVHLVATRGAAQRAIGVLLLLGVAVKLFSEAPWQGAVHTVEGWDIAIAPSAHLCGAMAGTLCGIVAAGVRRAWQGRRGPGGVSVSTVSDV